MSAAAALPLPVVAEPTPYYTRHMLGATEAGRDRRLQARAHGVHRYTSGPVLRVVEGGQSGPVAP
jgi:hypothetical protein